MASGGDNDRFACAVLADNSLECWATGNNYGALDHPSGNNFVSVTATRYSGCALDVDGIAQCWGQPYGSTGTIVPVPNDRFVQVHCEFVWLSHM